MSLRKEVIELKKNAITCTLQTAKRKIKGNCASKIGGQPSVPNGFVWPRDSFHDNESLTFIGQFNLDELKKYDKDNELPESGMLYLFYNFKAEVTGGSPSDKESVKVLYFDGEMDELTLADFPNDLEEDFIIPEFKIKFSRRKEFPRRDDFNLIKNQNYDYTDFEDLFDKLDYWLLKVQVKLLGYAENIQGSMLLDVSMVEDGINTNDFEHLKFKEKYIDFTNEWALLFQIGTIDNEEFSLEICDEGKLYVYIRKEDLHNKNFDNVIAMTQSF